MSTPTQEFSTAEYATVLGGDTDTAPSAPTSEKPTGTDQEATPSKPKPKPKAAEGEPSGTAETKPGRLRVVGDAKGWMPKDFAAAPAPLNETFAKHRERYQRFDNLGVKVLYGMVYVPVAVPTGIALNTLSLLAALGSIVINEPERTREAALGVVFWAIIVVALVALLG